MANRTVTSIRPLTIGEVAMLYAFYGSSIKYSNVHIIRGNYTGGLIGSAFLSVPHSPDGNVYYPNTSDGNNLYVTIFQVPAL